MGCGREEWVGCEEWAGRVRSGRSVRSGRGVRGVGQRGVPRVSWFALGCSPCCGVTPALLRGAVFPQPPRGRDVLLGSLCPLGSAVWAWPVRPECRDCPAAHLCLVRHYHHHLWPGLSGWRLLCHLSGAAWFPGCGPLWSHSVGCHSRGLAWGGSLLTLAAVGRAVALWPGYARSLGTWGAGPAA